MKFNTCYLNDENSIKLGDKTVASLLKDKGVKKLYSDRTSDIDTLIIHYMSNINASPTSPFKLEELLSIFIEYGVSAHFLILRDGTTLNLVPPQKKAWHAGGSIMPTPDNRKGVNDFSIGVELAGSATHTFTKEQYTALTELTKTLHSEYHFSAILGHEDISGKRAIEMKLRKDKKVDPGPQFNWKKYKESLPQTLSKAFKNRD